MTRNDLFHTLIVVLLVVVIAAIFYLCTLVKLVLAKEEGAMLMTSLIGKFEHGVAINMTPLEQEPQLIMMEEVVADE